MSPGPCRPLVWLLFVMGAGLIGCGTSEKPELTVFPVSGSVAVDGKPPVRAEVRLRPSSPLQDPAQRSIEPYGYVQPDGTFRIGTYLDDDGAPPGEYAITIVWPTITIEGGEEIAGPDRLRGRFSNPAQPVAKIVVKEDADTYVPEIVLKTK